MRPPLWQSLLGAAVLGWSTLTTQAVVRFWPEAAASPEPRYLLLVTLCGALGANIHLAVSFLDYAGNGRLRPHWLWWYLLRPVLGAKLALIVYFVLRAGLLAGVGDASGAALNPHGLAAVSALCGLFSRQAMDKLREVCEQVFALRQPVPRNDDLG